MSKSPGFPMTRIALGAVSLMSVIFILCLSLSGGKKREQIELAADLCTGVVALSALVIAGYSAETSARQRRESQMPVVVLEAVTKAASGEINDRNEPGRLQLKNRGIGPALNLRAEWNPSSTSTGATLSEESKGVLTAFSSVFPAVIGAQQSVDVEWDYSIIRDIFHGTHNVVGTKEYEAYKAARVPTYREMAVVWLTYRDIFDNSYRVRMSLETRADPKGSYSPEFRVSDFHTSLPGTRRSFATKVRGSLSGQDH